MTWTIRKELLRSALLDESGIQAARIQCRGGDYLIQDLSGNSLCEISDHGHHILTFSGRQKGTIRLMINDRPGSLLPPRAREAFVRTGSEEIRILQDEQRHFLLYRQTRQIGSLEDLLAFRVRFELDHPFRADQVALLYSVAHRMLHEDDIDYI